MKKQFKWFAVITAATMLATAMCACNSERQPAVNEDDKTQVQMETAQESSEKEQKEEVQEDSEKYMEIETPYTTLLYPEQWAEALKVEVTEGDEYVVSFSADVEGETKQPLFDLTFGDGLDNKMGSIQLEDGSVVDVAVNFASLDNVNNDTILSMQEAANELLSKLPLSREPIVEAVADLAIETSYGNLSFPGEWKDSVTVQQEDNSVLFYANVNEQTIKLFAVEFGVDEDSAIGSMLDTNNESVTVGISMEEINLDNSWSDEEKNMLYTMQESINHVLDNIDFVNQVN